MEDSHQSFPILIPAIDPESILLDSNIIPTKTLEPTLKQQNNENFAHSCRYPLRDRMLQKSSQEVFCNCIISNICLKASQISNQLQVQNNFPLEEPLEPTLEEGGLENFYGQLLGFLGRSQLLLLKTVWKVASNLLYMSLLLKTRSRVADSEFKRDLKHNIRRIFRTKIEELKYRITEYGQLPISP